MSTTAPTPTPKLINISLDDLRIIRRALLAANEVIENTYGHDDDGERVDEPGEDSAADIVEQLANIEYSIDEAMDAVNAVLPD